MKILSSTLRVAAGVMAARVAIPVLRGWLKLAPGHRAAAAALLARAKAAGDRPAMRAALEAMLKADPADAGALARLAELFLAEGEAEAAHAAYVRLADLEKDPRQLALYRTAHMDPARAAASEPYVHTLRDVVLETERCAIFDGASVYIRETSGMNLENLVHIKVRATSDRMAFVMPRPEPTAAIEEPFVLIGTDGGINYGHWLNRDLLKLSLLERAGVPETLPLLVNENLRPYQLESLELIGIPESRLLRVKSGEVLQCRELRVPVLLRNHPRMRTAIDWLRARLKALIEPEKEARDLLYVSRRDSRNHVLLNEQEVEDELVRRGFRSIVLSGMPFAEQVRAFSRARVVAGAAGAGLVNLMFSPPHAVLVEITNTNLRHMNEFHSICEQMGMRHVEIVSNTYSAASAGKWAPHRDFYVDLRELSESLNGIPGVPAG